MDSTDSEDVLNLDECLEFATYLVKKVSAHVVKRENMTLLNSEMKDHRKDLVTYTDIEVERMIIDGIHENYPDHLFIGEENHASKNVALKITEDPTWIIDPIDGTMNFVHSFPFFAVSLALFINNRCEIAVVYNPVLFHCFSARRGKGAWLNGEVISTSGQTELKHALIMHELGAGIYQQRIKVLLENSRILARKAHGLRSIGSGALACCMVATGQVDAYYQFGTHIWDIAAGDLIVRESGGVTTDTDGSKLDLMNRRILAAATPDLAAELANALVQYEPLPRDDEVGRSALETLDEDTDDFNSKSKFQKVEQRNQMSQANLIQTTYIPVQKADNQSSDSDEKEAKQSKKHVTEANPLNAPTTSDDVCDCKTATPCQCARSKNRKTN